MLIRPGFSVTKSNVTEWPGKVSKFLGQMEARGRRHHLSQRRPRPGAVAFEAGTRAVALTKNLPSQKI